MKTLFYTTLTALILALRLNACKKEEDAMDDSKQNEIKHLYSGSGSHGDLITFNINSTLNTYTVDNETTGNQSTGSYSTLTDPNLKGIYNVTAGTDQFYAVELTDKIIAANFPTGNPLNTISFGVSSLFDNSNNTSSISGDYVFIVMDNTGIMNDATIKEWGILNVKNDNTWIKKNFATNTGDGSVTEMSPDLFTGSIPITTGDETGTWTVNGTHKERLVVKVTGSTTDLSGYVYATPNEAAFLLDLGTGNGFLLGLKIDATASLSSIAGDYKYINVWDNGQGAGNYSINSTGKVDWTHKGSDGSSSGTFQLTQCTNGFKNVFYAKKAQIETNYYEDIYCVIVGDIMMHFSFDESNGDFAQYGAGAKLTP
jgi:hypothetical protein